MLNLGEIDRESENLTYLASGYEKLRNRTSSTLVSMCQVFSSFRILSLLIHICTVVVHAIFGEAATSPFLIIPLSSAVVYAVQYKMALHIRYIIHRR